MTSLIDKWILLLVCLAFYIPYTDALYSVIPVLVIVSMSAFISYMALSNTPKPWLLLLLYLLACFLLVDCLFFLPIICYDAHFIVGKKRSLLCFTPLFFFSSLGLIPQVFFIGGLTLLGYTLASRTNHLIKLKKAHEELRDTTKEISTQLERQNKELIKKQNDQIHLATLSERNRIARDIHDNVGHLLSRSILQVGALLATTKDHPLKESLQLIQTTLSEAMDSIRKNVHNLHEASIDLSTELDQLVNNFHFCPVEFTCDITSTVPKEIKYCFISVVKEAFSNITKHSKATWVHLKVAEHPAFYQLIITDNGTASSYSLEEGIGLQNIITRTESLNGNIHISCDKGFRIFISIPKLSS
jgi:signal transduction histidine kinase